MRFTFYGHGAFAIEVNGKTILIDPFFTGNPSAKDIDIDKIKADYIFVTHGHGDHTGDLVSMAKKTGAVCVAAAEIAGWLGSMGVEKVHPVNYAGNPMGFVFTTPEGNFYVAGDTALTMDMQLIPLWAKLDFSVFPIGGNYTMDADDAIHAADFVKCNTVIGVHYNTWPIIQIDTEQAKANFAAAGKKLLLPAPGETIEL
jgi:L-ascorbate metabolism protein UlaG (beta-lactamase superfamily)